MKLRISDVRQSHQPRMYKLMTGHLNPSFFAQYMGSLILAYGGLFVQRHRTSSPRKITPWSRFLHYKLTVPQLVKKLLPFYGT
jgi:hypothetical protein